MITLSNLTLAYQQKCLLRSANVTFGSGTLTALIGRNGAGKSTTLRTLLGLIAPTSGSAQIFGKDITKHHTEILSNIGFLPSMYRSTYSVLGTISSSPII